MPSDDGGSLGVDGHRALVGCDLYHVGQRPTVTLRDGDDYCLRPDAVGGRYELGRPHERLRGGDVLRQDIGDGLCPEQRYAGFSFRADRSPRNDRIQERSE